MDLPAYKVSIIEHIERRQCSRCEGNKIDRDIIPYGFPCPSCDGTGHVEIQVGFTDVLIEFAPDVHEAIVSSVFKFTTKYVTDPYLLFDKNTIEIIRYHIHEHLMWLALNRIIFRGFDGRWEYKETMTNGTVITEIEFDTSCTAYSVLAAAKIELLPSGFYQVYYLWDELKSRGMESQWYIGGSYSSPLAAACSVACKLSIHNNDDKTYEDNHRALMKYKYPFDGDL